MSRVVDPDAARPLSAARLNPWAATAAATS